MSEIQNELQVIKSLYEKNPNLIIFDIGAHTFDDGMNYKRFFPNIEVYAFEPDTRNLNYYANRAEMVGINVVPIALSDENSESMFYPSDKVNDSEWTASGGLFRMKDGRYPTITWSDGYTVQIVRIDTFCELNSIEKIDYIHMDVQGAEYKVMNGIGKYRPSYIFAETCEFDNYDTGVTENEFNNLMEELGYKIERKFDSDTLYKHKNLINE